MMPCIGLLLKEITSHILWKWEGGKKNYTCNIAVKEFNTRYRAILKEKAKDVLNSSTGSLNAM